MSGRISRALARVWRATPSVPVLVYHSIGPANGHPVWGHLTLPVEAFEAQLAWLQNRGYQTVTLAALHAYLTDGTPLPDRPVVLTFDDGFLDTWVYACPLLARFGFQATLFLCPAFVQAGDGTRPQRRATGATQGDPKEWWGYVRWDEARALLRSGVFDIQAHGLTHRRYFTSPRIVDYLRPGAPYYWCRWNAAPDRQPYWLTEPFLAEEEYGTPVYEHDEALVAHQYRPDPALADYTRQFVAKAGGAAFFARAEWRTQLDSAVRTWIADRGERGTHETPAEYRERALHELTASRRILSEQLDTDIDFLCWPVDVYSDEAHALAMEAGYRATTCMERPNVPGVDPTRIGRTYFGQSEQSHRVGKPSLVNLKFRGLVQLLSGRRAGYLQLFCANRLLAWYDRSQHDAPKAEGVYG